MDLKWEYKLKNIGLHSLVAELKTNSSLTILTVYKNRLGYSSFVSPQYSSFIMPYSITYSDISIAQAILHIPYSIKSQTEYACRQIEKDFYAQRDNILKLLS